MLKTRLVVALAAAFAFGLAGCDVKKTQEGKYEITPPDVKIGKTQKEVTVPKVVEGEKKTIEVPKVDIKTAKEKEQEQASRQMGAASSSSR